MASPVRHAPNQAVGPEIRQQFADDGCVIIRNVVEDHWLDLLTQGLDACIAEGDNMSTELAGERGSIRIDQFPALRSPELQRFIAESPVAEVVGRLTEAPQRFYMDQMFAKPAGHQMATAWHQDSGYYNVDGDQLIRAWVSPDVVPREASLEVARGSHRWNVTYQTAIASAGRSSSASERRVSGPGTDSEGFAYTNASIDRSLPPLPDIEANRASFDIIGWDYEPGDVIVFHASMLHGARGEHTLAHQRRAHAAMFAGPEVRFVDRPGQVIPDPAVLAGHAPIPGETLDRYDDVFPIVWES